MKDPGFIFYPGDYLRDTQCLSEKVQVSYDRIMCEHMRNICISQTQLNFFTQKLNEDEKNELLSVLSKNKDGFYIEWVSESINKRRAYSDSRRENRKGKSKEDMTHVCESYVSHMDNENEIEDINTENNILLFDEFRKIYPGTKRGNKTEFENFCKKHKDWKLVLPFLKTAIENQIKFRETKKAKGEFVPEWKNLSTWINTRCWEEETVSEKNTLVKNTVPDGIHTQFEFNPNWDGE